MVKTPSTEEAQPVPGHATFQLLSQPVQGRASQVRILLHPFFTAPPLLQPTCPPLSLNLQTAGVQSAQGSLGEAE